VRRIDSPPTLGLNIYQVHPLEGEGGRGGPGERGGGTVHCILEVEGGGERG